MTNALFSVYLAGPIAHVDPAEAIGWRELVIDMLESYSITLLSPLRNYYLLKDKLTRPLAILDDLKIEPERDFFDIRRADVVLANFLNATKPSNGTLIELGYAFALNKPIVVAIESEGNPNDNMLLKHITSCRTSTLQQAVNNILHLR